ncbi:hypothetical protein N5079_26450 [Planotetraspora sp. A-T 1434]|nr:hypothetical protein [Planotetraspora sp. A-T 1434]MCT9933759.1 hypothetical protein [Planotetraspora sp. A-T 1434]
MTSERFEPGLDLFGKACARIVELLGREVAPRVREPLTMEPAHV